MLVLLLLGLVWATKITKHCDVKVLENNTCIMNQNIEITDNDTQIEMNIQDQHILLDSILVVPAQEVVYSLNISTQMSLTLLNCVLQHSANIYLQAQRVSLLNTTINLTLPTSNLTLTALDQALLHHSSLLNQGQTSIVAYRNVSLSHSQLINSRHTCEQDVSPQGVLDPLVQNYTWFNQSHPADEDYMKVQRMLYYLSQMEQHHPHNYTCLLVSMSHMSISDSVIRAGRMGLFSKHFMNDPMSNLSATGMGCHLGKGRQQPRLFLPSGLPCPLNGASYGGYRGTGYNFNYTPQENQQCLKLYFEELIHQGLSPYGNKRYPLEEGSGGGLITGSPQSNAGGGVIIISAIELLNQGVVESQGQSTSPSYLHCGGASGGSVFIKYKHIWNHGKISAKGGDGGQLGCGEGSGGRVKLECLFYSIASEDVQGSRECTQSMRAHSVDVSPGDRVWPMDPSNKTAFFAQNGSVYKSVCAMGNQILDGSCVPCRPGWYSTDGIRCEQCLNRPAHVYNHRNPLWYQQTDLYQQYFMQCQYTCGHTTAGLPIDKNEFDQCESELNFLGEQLAGWYYWVAITVVLSAFVLGLTLNLLLEIRANKKQSQNDSIVKLLLEVLQQGQGTAREQKEGLQKVDRMFFQNHNQMNLAKDLPYQVHRIQVYGSNRFDNRWFMSKDPPEEVDYLVSRKDYASFVISFNEIAKWSSATGVLLRVLALLYYPLYILIMRRIRIAKYRALRRFIQNKISYSFWRAVSHDLQFVKIKFCCSQDYTVAFLSICNYQSPVDMNALNPLVLSINGEGCFSRPFHLLPGDPLVLLLRALLLHRRALRCQQKLEHHPSFFHRRYSASYFHQQFFPQTTYKLLRFLRKLNKALSLLDYSSRTSVFVAHLGKAVSLVKQWNINFFNLEYFQLDLVATQVPRERYPDQYNTVTLLECKSDKLELFVQRLLRAKNLFSLYDVRYQLVVTDLLQDQRGGRQIDFMVASLKAEPSVSTYEVSLVNEPGPGGSEIKAIQNRLLHKNNSQEKFYTHWVDTKDPILHFSKLAKKIKLNKILKVVVTRLRNLFIAHKKKPSGLSQYSLELLVAVISTLDVLGSLLLVGVVVNRDYLKFLLYLFVPFPFACPLNLVLQVVLLASRSHDIGLLTFYYNFYWSANLVFSFCYDPLDHFIMKIFKGALLLLKAVLSLLLCYLQPSLVVRSLS